MFCLKTVLFQLDLMHVQSCIFFWGTLLIHNQLLNGGGGEEIERKGDTHTKPIFVGCMTH